jgi:hypothetical protein
MRKVVKSLQIMVDGGSMSGPNGVPNEAGVGRRLGVRRHPVPPTAEAGFGLVELSVAVLLAMMLVLAFSGTLRGALSGSRENRFRQEATGLGLERLELARSLGWEGLALSEIDPDAPLIDSDREVLLAEPTGLPADESLRTCESGVLAPRVDATIQDIQFTTWTYVTQPSATLRRVYVLVEWNGEVGTRPSRPEPPPPLPDRLSRMLRSWRREISICIPATPSARPRGPMPPTCSPTGISETTMPPSTAI